MNATNNVIRMAGRRQRVVQSVVEEEEEEVGRERERGERSLWHVPSRNQKACGV